jgi:hypothetical protein
LVRPALAAARPRHDDCLHRRPSPARRLAENEDRIGPVAAHQPIHHVERHPAKTGERRDRFLVLPLAGEVDERRLVELAVPMQRLDRALSRRIVARRRFGGHFMGDFRQHPPDLGLRLGLGRREQPLLNHLGGLEQEIAKQPRRNVGSQPDLFGQHAVLFRPVDKRKETVLGEASIAVVRHAVHDVATPAPHQHVRHRLGNAGPLGNGEQVRLALGLGNIDEIGLGEPRRLLEHRAGDRDVVILREPPYHVDWRIADGCEPVGQLGTRLGLDLADQSAEHLVEQSDMIVVEPAGAIEKKGGDALERLGAPLGRAVLNHLFQFRNERGIRHPQVQTPGSHERSGRPPPAH